VNQLHRRGPRIDAFTHLAPPVFRDRVLGLNGSNDDLETWTSIPGISDVGLRLEMMNRAGIDRQVVCTPSPPVDEMFDTATAQELARQANDEVAEIVRTHPDRFIGTATLSLRDPTWAAIELRRAVEDLGLRGCLLYTSVNGRPIDSDGFCPLYEALEGLDVPAWLHPERSSRQPDYAGEDGSKYGFFLVFGWPYETTIAMARLVFSGTMQHHPKLKVIAHHAGAMIPRLANRIRSHYQDLPRVHRPEGLELPPIEYFRRFYVDTVTQGSVSALMGALEVFGSDRMVFASDFPFGTNGGEDFIAAEQEALTLMPIDADEKRGVWGETILALCGLPNEDLPARGSA
jgi:predicted TIM-barrel fold metal-dependent hydrolase